MTSKHSSPPKRAFKKWKMRQPGLLVDWIQIFNDNLTLAHFDEFRESLAAARVEQLQVRLQIDTNKLRLFHS